MNETKIAAEPGQPSLTITRVFDAPRHLVWKAITTPALVRQWWGPRSCTEMVSCEMDVRVGGRWRFVIAQNGQQVSFFGEYREIVAPDRIVQTYVFEPFPDAPAVETMTLTDLGKDQTLLTVVMVHVSVEARDGMLFSGMEGGMKESHVQLETLIRSL